MWWKYDHDMLVIMSIMTDGSHDFCGDHFGGVDRDGRSGDCG
jgi:hypothetical protein